jgi:2-haloacid dehalogenase
MTYRLILFDLDDTLLDFGATQAAAFDATLAKYAIETGDGALYAQYMHFSRQCWRRHEEGSLSKALLRTERFRLTLEWWGVHDAPVDELSQAYLDELPRHPFLIEGAVDVCRRLSQVATVGVVTNGFEAVQRARLTVAPFREHVTFMLTSEAVGAPKPERPIFDRALDLGEARASDTVMVGDNPSSDIAGAHARGIDTVWLAPADAEPEVEVSPTYRVERLAELLDLPRFGAHAAEA